MSEATERLDKMIAEMPPNRGPRIPFPQQCGAFYALHRGFKRSLVAKAFGLSQATVSQLANCQRRPEKGTWHYGAVAREFLRRGEKDFGEIYFTPDIADRIARIRMDAPEPGDIRVRAPDENAAKYDVHNFGSFEVERIDGSIVTLEIEYRAGDHQKSDPAWPLLPDGWTWRECTDPDGWTKAKRHRTSSQAYDAAFEDHGQESPRKRPGRT